MDSYKQRLNLQKSVVSLRGIAAPRRRWERLREGLIKVNVDGALAGIRGDCVAIAQDSEGHFLGALAAPMIKAKEVDHVEAKALLLGLSLVDKLENPPFIIESDNSNLV